MNKILIFALGVGVGGTLAYFITKEHFEQIAIEEIDEMRDYYREKVEEVEGVKDEGRKIVPESSYKKPLKDVADKSKYTQYSDMYKSENDDRPEESPGDEERPDEHYYDQQEKYEQPDKPYIISREDYDDTNFHYDKEELGYYVKDDTLCDENEEIISDPDYTVGGDSLTKFGEESEDPDIVYVRNELISTDFKIIRMNESYREVILGIEEEDEHPQMRRKEDEE